MNNLLTSGLGPIPYVALQTETTYICLHFQVLEISIAYEIYDELDSPEVECIYPPNPPPKPALGSTQSGSIGSYSSNASDSKVM